jgi:hypothetical protein
MPQARSSGSSSGSSSGGSGSSRSSASRSGAKRSSTTRASGSRSSGTRRKSASSTASRTRTTRSTSARSTGARAAKTASAGAAQAASAADARVEAVAQRVRKLNERIIEESKSAGEATLTAYEKALKAIASSLERGPGKSDVEWVSALATTQAKWIRDVTSAWTSAARGMLK